MESPSRRPSASVTGLTMLSCVEELSAKVATTAGGGAVAASGPDAAVAETGQAAAPQNARRSSRIVARMQVTTTERIEIGCVRGAMLSFIRDMVKGINLSTVGNS